MITVQDHEVPEPDIASLLVAAAPAIVIAQVGVPMTSELVIEIVTVSPSSVLLVAVSYTHLTLPTILLV